jgi:hypothetical protein
MRPPSARVAQLQVTDRRHDLLATLEDLAPSMLARIESVGLYVLIACFWGLILYFALQSL